MEKLLLGKRTVYSEKLKIQTTFYIPFAKSVSKKERAELAGSYCVGNFDLDNLDKALWDCLNNVVWIDDKQVVEHLSRKVWTDGEGQIELKIERLK